MFLGCGSGSCGNAFQEFNMTFEHRAAASERKPLSRFSLSPTLSPRRGGTSAASPKDGWASPRPSISAGWVPAAIVRAQPDRNGCRPSGGPRSFLPLLGGEGWGEGESQALLCLPRSRRNSRKALGHVGKFCELKVFPMNPGHGSRFALTPTLSPWERGNFSGGVEIRLVEQTQKGRRGSSGAIRGSCSHPSERNNRRLRA